MTQTTQFIIFAALGIATLLIGVTYNLTWSAASNAAYDQARQDLANKAIAHVVPKIHERVTMAMTASAMALKTVATEIEKTTWPDTIQSEMETLAKLYQRTITQLESHEINDSAHRFLDASISDIHAAWYQINQQIDTVTGAPLTPKMQNDLAQMKRKGDYNLVVASNFLSAALMLEEGGFGENQ